MSMVRDILSRATNQPLNVVAALAAGAMAPRFLGNTMQQMGNLLSPAAGAATFYMLDEAQDSTSLMIGGIAGQFGPRVFESIGVNI